MIRVNDVAREFGVSRQAVVNWIHKGSLIAIKPGKSYFIEDSEIERIKEKKCGSRN